MNTDHKPDQQLGAAHQATLSARVRQYKLENPKIVRLAVGFGVVALLVIMVIDAIMHFGLKWHANFKAPGDPQFDVWYKFYPIFGYGACVLILFVAQIIGRVLTVRDTYYEESREPLDDHAPVQGPRGG